MTGAWKVSLEPGACFLPHFSCVRSVCSLNSHFRAGNSWVSIKNRQPPARRCVEPRGETNIFTTLYTTFALSAHCTSSVAPSTFLRPFFFFPFSSLEPSVRVSSFDPRKRASVCLREPVKAQPSGLFAHFRSGLLAHRRFND